MQEIKNLIEKNQNIRNIGIIAHIDAGKTTTTERILFYTKSKKSLGEVHEGDTTTDWMPQEKARGITITSAAVSCFWNNKQINLIDTPGHIDFEIEVERSIRVLDGVVIVLCAVAGVQPQTESVWMKAEKIPKIIFVNKMDRKGANFMNVINEIAEKFSEQTITLNLPIGEDNSFIGYYDFIYNKIIYYDHIENYDYNEEFNETTLNISEAINLNIINNDFADEIINIYRPIFFETLNISIDSDVLKIKSKIRELVINNQIIPILAGTALKNKGFKILLDSITDFLPNPFDRPDFSAIINNNLCSIKKESELTSALIFKTTNDKYVGNLAFCRIYSGIIKSGIFLFNSNIKKNVRISRVVRLHANIRNDIPLAASGDIIGILGLEGTISGDTLCDKDNNLKLENINIPEPVVSSAIIINDKESVDRLPDALQKLRYEDPSFTFYINNETKQTVIAGRGNLHLDIMKDRLIKDFNVNISLSQPKVIYKETIRNESGIEEAIFKKQTGGHGQYAHIVMSLEPIEPNEILFESKITGGVIKSSYISTIEKSFLEICKEGCLAGFPIEGIKMTLLDGSQHEVDSSDHVFKLVTRQAFKSAYDKCCPILKEPITKTVVVTPEEFLSTIIDDIQSKRGKILNIEDKNKYKIITTLIPRIYLFDYASDLRAMSSGRAFYSSMEHYDYQIMIQSLCDEVVAKEAEFVFRIR